MVTNVYIDGFNLYYRALRQTPYKWVDLAKLADLLLPGHDIRKIRYYTARVSARKGNEQTQLRQNVYLRALKTIPNLEIHYGNFLSKPKTLPLVSSLDQRPKFVEVLNTEEKGSDVNLATGLLVDAFHDEFQQALVISNDSDLKAPIEAVRAEFQKRVVVAITDPRARKSALPADDYRRIRPGSLQGSQFPDQLFDERGIPITKPSRWS